jgi:hypothetical protein
MRYIHNLDGIPEGRRQLGRPRNREEDSNSTGHREIGCEGIDCICLAQDRDLW